MPLLRRRAKKLLKRKYGKDITLSDVDKIWAEYYKYGIEKPLIQFGRVQIDRRFSIEIVGTRLENNPNMLNLMVKGLNKQGVIKEAVKFNPSRPGINYSIVVIDRNCKEKMIFEAHPELKEVVHQALVNTENHYRILR